MSMINHHESALTEYTDNMVLYHISMRRLEYAHNLRNHSIQMAKGYQGLIDEIFSYYKENNLEVPNRKKINRTLEKYKELVDASVCFEKECPPNMD